MFDFHDYNKHFLDYESHFKIIREISLLQSYRENVEDKRTNERGNF